MYLVIELTNGVQDACGDCECVAEIIAGTSTKRELEKELKHKIPEYYFTERVDY
jgi:hypothetical protein